MSDTTKLRHGCDNVGGSRDGGRMRYVSVFSGVEAATLAWHRLGWEPVAFSEIDPFPSSVLAERFPNAPNLGDITQIDWSEIGAVDLVVGGSPCQSFSVAGKREGLAGASGLMFEYIRCVRELRPKWFVWENVPGALSSEGGAAFGQLLTEMDELGYGLAWRVLDAQFFGVAQRRRRVFLVGSLGDGGARRACEVLFERACVPWNPRQSREKRAELAARVGDRAAISGVCVQGDIARGAHMGQNGLGYRTDGASYTLNTMDRNAVLCMTDTQTNTMVSDEVCGTLAHRMHKDAPVVSIHQNQIGDVHVTEEMTGTITAESSVSRQQLVYDTVVRRLTPRECERLQGMPDDWTRVPYRGKSAEDCPDGPRYKAIGNSMAVPVMRWIGERIAMVDKLEGRCE